MNYKPIIEGILFLVGDEGISIEELKNILEIDDLIFNKELEELKKEYESDNRGIKIEFLGNKLKFTTKKEHKKYYERLTEEEISSTLSPASLEALVIIAYNQPITRMKVDEIRGVGSSHLIRKLLLKNLIKELGKSDAPGRPNLYGTTDKFLDYFGLKTIEDLPKIEEIEENDDEKNLFESKYTETL